MKIAMVSTLMPETHYTRYLVSSLANNFHESKWYVYANKLENIKPLSSNLTLRQCWSKNLLYLFQIARQAVTDKIDILHIQHEINMYGGPITAVVFPLVIILLRFLKKKTVVTIHAVVPKKEIAPPVLSDLFSARDEIVQIIERSISNGPQSDLYPSVRTSLCYQWKSRSAFPR